MLALRWAHTAHRWRSEAWVSLSICYAPMVAADITVRLANLNLELYLMFVERLSTPVPRAHDLIAAR